MQDVAAPTIKGYTLKDKNLANINGQYLWLSTPESLNGNAKLASGLDEYLTKDTTINVVYTKNGAKAAAGGQNQNSNGNANGQNSQSQNSNNGNAQNYNGGNTQSYNGSNDSGNANNGSVGSNSGSGSTGALPQTGNKPANWLIMGFTSALSALGLGFLASRKHRA